MALRAAELLDDGLTDQQVFRTLKKEFPKKKFSARTVGSFRKADYEEVAGKRLERADQARRVEMILESARGTGVSMAELSQDILARKFYELLESAEAEGLSAKDLKAIGNTVAKIVELSIQRERVAIDREKEEAARAVKEAVSDKKLTGKDLVDRVDEIMGLKKK
jgi:hypothetical protein